VLPHVCPSLVVREGHSTIALFHIHIASFIVRQYLLQQRSGLLQQFRLLGHSNIPTPSIEPAEIEAAQAAVCDAYFSLGLCLVGDQASVFERFDFGEEVFADRFEEGEVSFGVLAEVFFSIVENGRRSGGGRRVRRRGRIVRD
jgi:hypothetical protein